MKRIDLVQVEHDVKVGQDCPMIEPNIKEDCIFYADGKPVGFFMRQIKGKLKDFIEIANKELRSKRVPKQDMTRPKCLGYDENGKGIYRRVVQYSTIIGGVPPKPHMRRHYPTISSVHQKKSAQTYIKAMLLAARESEALIKEIMPEQYEFQKQCIAENCPEEFRFGELFTSSIANYNISAPYHIDGANLKGCVNVIITKRLNAKGGNLHVPDYGATMDSCNNSILVYPAWRNVHGVTPIEETATDGYRNSLVFYPLAAFSKYVKKPA